MKYGTKVDTPENRCMVCGDVCRRPKRFCSDAHKDEFLAGRGIVLNHRGIEQVSADRQRLGITPLALENRMKLSVQRPL
jgi:hypothetical protein